MIRCKLFLLLVAIFLAFQPQQASGQKCGVTVDREDLEHLHSIMEESGKVQLRNPETGPVPVKVHIVRRNDGTGGFPEQKLGQIFRSLNEYYTALPFQIEICEVNFINSTDYFNFGLADPDNDEAAIVHTDYTPEIVNLYCVGSFVNEENLCGFGNFPWLDYDMIVMKNSCMDDVAVLAHEFGHYFGLLHTHETAGGTELVNGSNCADAGDFLCDTAADPGLSGKVNRSCRYVGNERDANGDLYRPDPRNLMAYSLADCQDFFSPQQINRINYFYTNDRNYLRCGGADKGLPNLACHEGGSLTVEGAEVSLSNFKVINNGNAPAGSSRLTYYLSEDESIDESDFVLGDDFVRALDPGQTSTESFSQTISGVPAGSYYLMMFVDSENEVMESNERDNGCYFTSPQIVIENTVAECKCTSATASNICEDFESYIPGRLGRQSSCWTTWSGREGGNEDGYVGQTNDGYQYLAVQGSNPNGGEQDVVLKLGSRVRGNYNLAFTLFLFNGDKAYYNILHSFIPGRNDPNENEWAQEVFFDGNGQGNLKVGNRYYRFNYPTDKWMVVYQSIDLDNNSSTLWINNDPVHTWKFSYQANSTYGTKKLSAINFYPLDDDHRFFIDKIILEEASAYGSNRAAYNTVSVQQLIELPTELPMMEIEQQGLSEQEVQIFPNPTKDFFTVRANFEREAELTITIQNTIGQIVEHRSFGQIQNLNANFDISSRPAGVYLVTFKSGEELVVKRVVLE